ncbi:MAG: ABC transporter ATP-binding protein [Deltaproteobacteria bacterium]|nr:ABC transporter ATP-binding protein [Deltaproteobacteria bacterium]OQY15487.1 MAG: ABC transporter ATP-binding protein [Desulfobacterium sp. 4572_20]HDH87737.1 ABC transporter ATP-binding protein [Desulfobacteraceae bacterium]MBW2331912.1 ABC transporter ATP-binding protein [Deltaproteobacteria bacterium]MCD6265330.1 ABC transporter ATP-binding protein [Deltaproteobacteria bacterium]
MAVDIRNVTKKREQRYSYGLTLLRDCIEKDRVLPRDEDIFKKTILKVEDITINFGGLNALTDVNLELRDGELLAIIGPNGAGKTTLLNVISGFYRPQQGDVYFQDKKITHYSSHRIAEMGICRTFQNIALYTGLSVIDNIIAGRHPHIRYNFLIGMLYFPWARREEARQRAISEDIVDFLEMEHVRNTTVGTLAYGLRKRAELGRALALEPRVLLLDEPMAGMNLDEKEDIARFIIDIHEFLSIPIVMIEHDMGVVMDIADRIAVLDFGLKIGDGTPEEIRKNPKVVSAYLGEE